MNIQIRHYDRILLVELDGAVTEPDLMQVASFVNTIASKLGSVVLDLQKAQLEATVVSTVLRLKKQYEKSKLKFLIASPELIGADALSLTDAVTQIKTTESDRILEIFAQDKELQQIQKEIAKLRASLIAELGLKEAPETPLPKEEITRALGALEEKDKQLSRLFKTLSSEINHLSGKSDQIIMPGADNPDAVRVSEAKRRALDIVKSIKVLD